MSLNPLLKRCFFVASISTLTLSLTSTAVQAQFSSIPKFKDEGKNIPGFPEANARFVVLNSGVAAITRQRFQLPKDTFTYDIAGLTVFPYYQASEPLKEFLNNATTLGGMPITAFPSQPNLPQFVLPQTDTTPFHVPIPKVGDNKRPSSTRMALKNKRNKGEIPWMVAHQGGQAFGLPGDSDALVIVSQGTMFGACAARTMVLRCGTMWIMTGARPAAVLTKYGAVGVRPFSIAAIEQTWFNRVKAADLFGQPLEVHLASNHKGSVIGAGAAAAEPAAANGAAKSKDVTAGERIVGKVSVEKGKELILTDSAIASAGSSDYSESDKGEAIPELNDELIKSIPDLKLSKKKHDPDTSAFVKELRTINPPFTNLKMSSDYQKMFAEFGITPKMRRAEIHLQETATKNTAAKDAVYKVSMDSKYYVPIYSRAQVKGAGPAIFPKVSEDELTTLKLEKGLARYLGNTDIKIDENGKNVISSGDAIVAADDPMLIEANECRVWINGGAIAQIMVKKDLTVIRNISESSKRGIKVKIKSKNVELPLGAELIVASNAPALFTEMKIDGIERKGVHSIEMADGSAFINKSEVSLTTLMQYCPIMRKVYKSKDPADKRLVAKLMKTNVALNMVAPNQGTYRRMAGMPSTQN